jgi:serine/threonine protein kinase
MKWCPQCGTCFEEETLSCHRDDNRLVAALPGGRLLAGRFLLEQRLGSGGSGTVFRATQVGTGRTVAVKILAAHLASRPEWRGRFRREAAAAGRLKHPSIVDVLDHGTVEVEGTTVAFLAMEHLAGHPLSWYLRRGPISPILARRWLAEAASALEFAHRSGILHRDVKPDNIWIAELPGGAQQVRMLDFGLAKMLDLAAPASGGEVASGDSGMPDRPTALPVEELSPADLLAMTTVRRAPLDEGGPESPSLHPTIRLGMLVRGEVTPVGFEPSATPLPDLDHGPATELGTVMGTPAYMSPEQASGLPATAASDVYALGVVAFEMLTGSLPFEGTTDELLFHHRETPPPDPGGRNRKVPRSMRRAVLSALAKDPALRPASPLAFIGELSGSLRIDELASRALLLYFALAVMWGVSFVAVLSGLGPDEAAREGAMRALAATNLVYFLALSLVLMVVEYRRESRAERLWPLCLLAFPLVPVWLLLVWLDRRRDQRLDSGSDSEGSRSRRESGAW